VAARAALVLDKLAPSRAQQYRDSAIKAMKWADKQPSPGFTDTITAARSLAAAELYRLTGDSSWHQVFLDTTKLKGGAVKDINCGSDPHCHAAFVYARTKQPDVKTDVQNNARDTITGSADQLLAEQQKTAFRWTLDHPWVPIMWGMGPSVPKTVAILRAHALTGKAAYLEAATLTAQYTLGANPSGACFVTGLGRQNAHNPLIADFKYGGLPVYPGIPLYGMYDHRGIKQGDSLWWMVQWFHQPAGTFPGVETGKWPVLESHFDLYNLVPQSEFTVQQTSGPAAYAFGYLAAVKR
jgi:endoglucanase